MNDPNGLIHWRGRYHLFYQYNPNGARWGDIHWGHADSSDLVHWTRRPLAMAPQPGGPDADGCWSGCAVQAGERAAFLYTGVTRREDGDFDQRVCLAWGQGGLETLARDPVNPVVAAPPAGLRVVGFRDPSAWKQPDGWRMAVGSGEVGHGPLALVYASPDLRSWEYRGLLCRGGDVPSPGLPLGTMWECPSLFFDNGQAGLLVSAWEPGAGFGPLVMTGRYADPRFLPSRVERLDHGGSAFYAPQAFRDEKGRVLMFAWMQEARSQEAQERAGWSGVMSLPRELRIDDQGLPRYAFVPELESLRTGHRSLSGERIPAGRRDLGVRGAQVEIRVKFERGGAPRGGLSLLRSPGGEEETRLCIDWEAQRILLQRVRSSLVETLSDLEAPLPGSGESIELHLYLDASTIEVIAGQRTALSGRVYPAREDSLGLGFFADGGEILAPYLDLYLLATAW